jgi:hypothetical protein
MLRSRLGTFLWKEHAAAVCECFDPLFVGHCAISSGKIGVCGEYTSFGAGNRSMRNEQEFPI